MEKSNQPTENRNHTAEKAPSILVVGSGAIGGYYGAQLAKAGAIVSTIHRSDFDVVSQQGIHIDSMNGPIHFKPAQVLRQVADYPTGNQPGFPDYILVGLKVLEEISTAEIIRPAVGPNTTLLLLQNGVEIEEHVATAFPNNELLSGLAFICVSRTAPGHIKHTCYGRLTLGRFPSGASQAAKQLAELFEKSGTPCPVTKTVALDRWKKLVWNAAFNPISVLSQATTREILSHPPSSRLVRHVMEEVCQIATAAGYPLTETIIEKNIAATQRMKPYKTSMLVDYLAGRSMEVEAILGNAIRSAERNNIDVPNMQTLYGLLSLLAKNLHPGIQG